MLPTRILQFGGGNFLRGYLDWMVDRLNVAGHPVGRIAVVQSTSGNAAALANQGFYHLLTRGVSKGNAIDTCERVESIASVFHASSDWPRVLDLARSSELRFVFSNTTEAGIVTSPDDAIDALPPKSFPAKLTRVLLERFRAGLKGLVVVPCELIERNGQTLLACVRDTSARWQLPLEFVRWVESECVFVDTLVDRIVPGKPADAPDPFAVVAEPFCQLFLQSPVASVRDELPFDRVPGVEAIWTDDLSPYRVRKVRILNGAHTAMAMVGLSCGKPTVRSCMEDPLVCRYVQHLIENEVVPSLRVPASLEPTSYARDVFDRFRNPSVEHKLASIALNTSSKWRTRLLPTLIEARTPKPLTAYALSAFLFNYQPPHAPQDDAGTVARIQQAWRTGHVARAVLSDTALWQTDLARVDGLVEAVTEQLHQLATVGPVRALFDIMEPRCLPHRAPSVYAATT
jgi:tagaturonate reductase